MRHTAPFSMDFVNHFALLMASSVRCPSRNVQADYGRSTTTLFCFAQ